jgi:hypothetical protein
MDILLFTHLFISVLSFFSGMILLEWKYSSKGMITSKEQSEVILYTMIVSLVPLLNIRELYFNIKEIVELWK